MKASAATSGGAPRWLLPAFSICLIAFAFVLVSYAAKPVPLSVQATFVVQWPTNAATPEPTPVPRKTVPTATDTPDPNGSIDFCGATPEPGRLCKVPMPTPPPPTPYPDCTTFLQTPVNSGGLCAWPTLTPIPQ